MPWIVGTLVVPVLLGEIKVIKDKGLCKVEWRYGNDWNLNEINK